MKDLDTINMKEVVKAKGGFTVKELREYAMYPASSMTGHLTLYSFEDEGTNRALIAHRALMAVSKGVWVIELTHTAYSEEGIQTLQEIIEDTLMGAKVYLTEGRGVILLDRVFK